MKKENMNYDILWVGTIDTFKNGDVSKGSKADIDAI